MKTILILSGGVSEIPAINRAKELGLKPVVVDRNENAPGFGIPGVIKEVCSIADKEAILEIARKHAANGIVTFADPGVPSVAYVAAKMGLCGLSEESAMLGTNKVEMRKRLKEKGVPVPEFYYVKDKDEYLRAVSHFPERCIVKAPDCAGSRGIFLIKDVGNRADVDYAFDYSMSFSGTGEILVEEYMQGPEICAETISQHGVCHVVQVTDQKPKQPPYFTDCGYSQPCMLDPETVRKIREIAVDANLALGNVDGSSCTEMIITPDGPKVVELGLRLAGDFMTTKMVPLSNGVNMAEAVIKIALGEEVDLTPTLDKGCAVRYFIKERVGTIKQIVGIEEARKVEGIVDVGALKRVGDMAVPLRKSADRLAYVISQCDTPAEVIASAEKALEMIDFIVE